MTKSKRKVKIYVSAGGASLPVPFEEGMTVPKRPSPLAASYSAGVSPAVFSGSGSSEDKGSVRQPSTATKKSKAP